MILALVSLKLLLGTPEVNITPTITMVNEIVNPKRMVIISCVNSKFKIPINYRY